MTDDLPPDDRDEELASLLEVPPSTMSRASGWSRARSTTPARVALRRE
jgi:hypothetical protein